MQDSVDSKQIKLVTADSEQTSQQPAAVGCDAALSEPVESTINFSNRALAEAVIKKLSADEFLQVMEGASAEELNSLLQTLDAAQPAAKPGPAKNFLLRLFEGPTKTSLFEIIGWWEARRLPYNVIVGLAGLFTLIVWDTFRIATFSSLILPAIGYGIAANVCYTSGWMAELLARRLFKDRADHFGPILFALGLLFSLVITIMPTLAIILSPHI